MNESRLLWPLLTRVLGVFKVFRSDGQYHCTHQPPGLEKLNDSNQLFSDFFHPPWMIKNLHKAI